MLNFETEFLLDTTGIRRDGTTTPLIRAGTPCTLREFLPGDRVVVELESGEEVIVGAECVSAHPRGHVRISPDLA